MDKHIIVGVHITERAKHAGEVQKVFTEFGCQIRTRLGLHEANKGLLLSQRLNPARHGRR